MVVAGRVDALLPGQVLESNAYMLAALVGTCGGIAERAGSIADDPRAIETAVQEAIDGDGYDELIPVSGPEGIAWAHKLAAQEGISPEQVIAVGDGANDLPMLAIAGLAISAYPAYRLGSEFMPPLNEGDLLYMPTTLPGISITKAKELLQQTDKLIRAHPAVDRVFGKIGRAETATDPAPLTTPLQLADGAADAETADNTHLVLQVDQPAQSFVFEEVKERPVPSLLRGFSAPVRLHYHYSKADLRALMSRDDDGFVRWDSAQALATRVIRRSLRRV